MKKIFTLLVSFACIISMGVLPIHAEDENLLESVADQEKSFEVNEYQALLDELQAYQNAFRSNSILSEAQLKEYNELEAAKQAYPEFIYAQKELSVDELKNQGYNENQIEAIKNYDGSENMSLRASATVSGTLSLVTYYYNSSENRTYAGARYKGSWNGTPVLKLQDHIGVGLAGSNARFARLGTSGWISHADGSVYSPSVTYYSMSGVVFSFGIQNADGLLIRSFDVTYNGVADGRVGIMDYGATYVHSNISFGVSLNIGVSGSGPSAGLSFSISGNGSNMWRDIRTAYL